MTSGGNNCNDFPENQPTKKYSVDETASPGDGAIGATTLGGGTAISGGGMPDTGCGTLFQPVPAEFNHWCVPVSKQVKTCH